MHELCICRVDGTARKRPSRYTACWTSASRVESLLERCCSVERSDDRSRLNDDVQLNWRPLVSQWRLHSRSPRLRFASFIFHVVASKRNLVNCRMKHLSLSSCTISHRFRGILDAFGAVQYEDSNYKKWNFFFFICLSLIFSTWGCVALSPAQK